MSTPNGTPNVPRKPTATEVMRTMRFKKKAPSQPAPAPLPPSPGPPPGSVPSPPRLIHSADGSEWRWSLPTDNAPSRMIHPLPRRPEDAPRPRLPHSFNFNASSSMSNINTSANNPVHNSQAQGSTSRFPQPASQSNPGPVSMPKRKPSVPTTAVSMPPGDASVPTTGAPRSRRNALFPPPASTSQKRKAKNSTDAPVQGPSSGKRRRRTDPTSDEEDSNKRPSKRSIQEEIKNMAKNYRCM